MRIAYVNTYYKPNHTGGAHVHMGQFIKHSLELGHEIWAFPANHYPGIHTIPTDRLGQIRTLRKMDVLYVRLEHRPPNHCSWALPPLRFLYGFPAVIWEFNTTPEGGLLRGESKKMVQKAIDYLRHYGRGCDMAVCMTDSLGEYVQENLGIQRVLIAPNGSDPNLFRPDVKIVNRMKSFTEKFNVVWIGSAKIPYHDFTILRNAAQELWDRNKDNEVNFHIIGPSLVGEMANMPPNVYYWGADIYERIPNWLAAMQVGLYLTHGGPTYHSTPLKFFDYLASGLTVVSTSQPYFIRDLFEKMGQSDLLVPQGDSTYLANTLLRLAADRDRVKQLGATGRELIIDHYNWKKTVKDTYSALQEILKEKNTKKYGI